MTSPGIDPDPATVELDSADAAAATRHRTRRRRVIGGVAAVGVAAAIFVFAYFEPHKAFIDDEVSETIPGLDAVLAAEPESTNAAAAPPATDVSTSAVTTIPVATTIPDVITIPAVPATGAPATAVPATAPPTTAVPETSLPETTLPPTTVPAPENSLAASRAEAAASGQPVIVSQGEFFSGEHTTTGVALVVALPDGSLVVRFEGLDTSNGPDLRVVLSPDVASESWEYADRLIIDELKGNIGDQNYVIDPGIDLTAYRSVVIWCERFTVAFGAAPLDVQA